MGFKNVKEHYRIGHTVCVDEHGICIGSQYIHAIIVVGLNGEILKPYRDRHNEDLARYMKEMEADPAKLLELIQSPDTFASSITVFTYHLGDIIEKQCEKTGWPNVTHDGMMMFENTFSTDRSQVVAWAKQSLNCRITDELGWIERDEKSLAQRRNRLDQYQAAQARLEAEP